MVWISTETSGSHCWLHIQMVWGNFKTPDATPDQLHWSSCGWNPETIFIPPPQAYPQSLLESFWVIVRGGLRGRQLLPQPKEVGFLVQMNVQNLQQPQGIVISRVAGRELVPNQCSANRCWQTIMPHPRDSRTIRGQIVICSARRKTEWSPADCLAETTSPSIYWVIRKALTVVQGQVKSWWSTCGHLTFRTDKSQSRGASSQAPAARRLPGHLGQLA